ncbi:overlapping protein/movement protein [Ononis yellow mosaic virus]|uniref:66 kDa protein n=1 Tax=Ononis yellow mosaic virus TaxID=12153 RepID=P69_OYMV|nr:overlapping protein/movement protein [Ononis yellow mosaic virus]P20130.1 RecName: Full=66 kDa protein [Ononis yellow mosaic virus]AAA46795.1 protein of unknown function (OP) [Ononis yellow mosaic virus]
MSNGLRTSFERISLFHPQGFISESSAEFCCSAPSNLSPKFPMDHWERTSSFSPRCRHPDLRVRLQSSPPRGPQSDRNLPSLQPLELHGDRPGLCDVHETLQVQKIGLRQSKLLRTSKLPSHRGRFRSIPLHLHLSSEVRNRFHARCPDVLQPLSDTRPLHSVPLSSEAPLQSSCSPRKLLHRPLSPPKPLHLHNFRQHSSLCSRRSPCRKLRPTPRCNQLAQAQQHPLPSSKPLSLQAGILGPCPLPPHNKRSPSPAVIRKTAGILPHPKLPPSSRGHLPSSTSSSSPRSNRGVRCSVHLHKSRSNSQDLRSCRVRSNSLQQTPILMGHFKSLGQSPNLRSFERPRPTRRSLRLLPLSPQKVPTVHVPTHQQSGHKGPSLPRPHSPSRQTHHARLPHSKRVSLPNSVLHHDRPKRPIHFGSFPINVAPSHLLPRKLWSRASSPPTCSPTTSNHGHPEEALRFLPKNLPQHCQMALMENYCSHFSSPSSSVSFPEDHQSSLPPISTRWVQCSSPSFSLQSFLVIGDIPCPISFPLSSPQSHSSESLRGDSPPSSHLPSSPSSACSGDSFASCSSFGPSNPTSSASALGGNHFNFSFFS